MTAVTRVSDLKRGRVARQSIPTEGSLIRQFYDDLRRGEVVCFTHKNRNLKRQLSDFYGMEIEPVRTERGALIGSRLVGEWDGPYYIPVERIVSSLMETV